MSEYENPELAFENAKSEIYGIFPNIEGKKPIRFGSDYTKEQLVQNVLNLRQFMQNVGWDVATTRSLLSDLAESILYGDTTATFRRSEEDQNIVLNSLVCTFAPIKILQQTELDLSAHGFQAIPFGSSHDYGSVTFRKITVDEGTPTTRIG